MSTRNEDAFSHFLPTSLRAVIIACSYWVLSLSLTVVSGSIAAFLGCLLACYFVDWGNARPPLSKLRSLSIVIGSLVLCLLGVVLAWVYRKSDRIPLKRYAWEFDDSVPEWFPQTETPPEDSSREVSSADNSAAEIPAPKDNNDKPVE